MSYRSLGCSDGSQLSLIEFSFKIEHADADKTLLLCLFGIGGPFDGVDIDPVPERIDDDLFLKNNPGPIDDDLDVDFDKSESVL